MAAGPKLCSLCWGNLTHLAVKYRFIGSGEILSARGNKLYRFYESEAQRPQLIESKRLPFGNT